MKEYDIINAPLITELSIKLAKTQNVYTFNVDNRANKIEIAKAIGNQFKVSVLSVNTLRVLGKEKRQGRFVGLTTSYKKAFVKLKKGDKIEAFVV